ncbi:MAG: hypothetical protein K0R75_1258, partial [Paenibacillaceae bacterium]|nr:hypothetical protein [Paenibacillaceae bacterium]
MDAQFTALCRLSFGDKLHGVFFWFGGGERSGVARGEVGRKRGDEGTGKFGIPANSHCSSL